MGLRKHTLFLAATRPAMKWGVPVEGWTINLFGTFLFGMVMGSPLYWLLFFVFHLPMRAISDRNPNFFREIRMWFDTKGRLASVRFYALSIWAQKASEVPSSV